MFMAQRRRRPVIDVAVNQGYFEHRFSHPGSRLVVYRRDLQEGIDPGDARVSYRNSFCPSNALPVSSHQSIHIAPAIRTMGRTATIEAAARPPTRAPRRWRAAWPPRIHGEGRWSARAGRRSPTQGLWRG